jgi:hypothetical protein
MHGEAVRRASGWLCSQGFTDSDEKFLHSARTTLIRENSSRRPRSVPGPPNSPGNVLASHSWLERQRPLRTAGADEPAISMVSLAQSSQDEIVAVPSGAIWAIGRPNRVMRTAVQAALNLEIAISRMRLLLPC